MREDSSFSETSAHNTQTARRHYQKTVIFGSWPVRVWFIKGKRHERQCICVYPWRSRHIELSKWTIFVYIRTALPTW